MIRSWRRYAFCLLHTAPQEPLLHIFCTSSRMRFHKVNKSSFSSYTGDLHLQHAQFLKNYIINMYVKCGSLVDARKVFDDMTERDVSSWNTILAAYRRHGYAQEALALFQQMRRTDVQPDQFTFATILPACAKIRALEQGINIHQSAIERGYLSDIVITSALLDMYAKCGNINKARELFDKMPERSVISWNAMIAGYAQNGEVDEALRIFNESPQKNVVSWTAMIAGYAQNGFVEKAMEYYKQMQLAGVNPNSTTLASILPACAKMGALEQGMGVHQSIMESGVLSNAIVASALIDMYAKCGLIDKARELFDKMPKRNVISWNAMIGGYSQNGLFEKALEAFKEMRLADVKADYTTFASILPACAKMGALEQGVDIHQRIIESGLFSNVVVANALIDMYAKCGSIYKARELFNKMPERDVISWNAMVAGYAQNGFCKDAFKLFELMKDSGLHPNHKWAGGLRFKW
ncbi:pentatricopeptide repeat-containing protein At2g13600 isoform X2 [Cryptomeria japonica]|uniref:pentatricopeptide repeat-containing protein At2g13600 isoform X2 n=1 Tax=Cryptomeria japonica TaxID=3369 RepID=UPI0027DA4476|nr:pentatricopeptide repeat-containing protein At2g13600 isoform X2 [Cryptomeria japonica]